jgi:hypothetical protein
MKRIVWAVLAVVTMAALVATPAVAATSGELPGGTSISVDITSPQPEGGFAFVETGTDLVVTGTASVGTGVAVPDTSIVYLIDVSGSMNSPVGSEIDCDTEGAPSRLDCAKRAAITVNEAAIASGNVLNGAVIPFADTATTQPPGGLTTNLGSLNGVIDGLNAGGGTSFQAAIAQANAVLSSSTATHKIILIISDGENGGTVSNPGLPPGTVVRAFAIGGAGCGYGEGGFISPGSLAAVAALTPGGTCETITDDNLSGLGGIISAAIGSTLGSVVVTVDGGPPIAATASLPAAGPATRSFSATVPAAQLPIGQRTVCATATGATAAGQGSVTDCVTVDIVGTTVDCGAVPAAACRLEANDGNIASAVVRGLGGFDKTLGLTAGLAGADENCLGRTCRTAFNVQFPDTGLANSGKVVQVVVTMSRAASPPPGRARAFLEVDGVTTRITNRCHARRGARPEALPCVKVTRVSGGRTQYLVRFDGDPFVKFR